ncbi:MAG: hypothetical protein GX601_15300 [Anaerolineales bacterium]|nr:hypothetical protein [Anaerolineales bacterium]
MPQSIPLTRGYVTLVDDADYPTVSRWKWQYVGNSYAGRFVITDGKSKCVYLHRFLLDAPPDQRVDHINGDPLDNRRENLRLVTARQNVQNSRCAHHSLSGQKGVAWYRRKERWHVRITVDGERLHLGYYRDLETAALLYDAAARHFFGAYARPNYPNRPTPPEIALLLAERLHRHARRMAGCRSHCDWCDVCLTAARVHGLPGEPVATATMLTSTVLTETRED